MGRKDEGVKILMLVKEDYFQRKVKMIMHFLSLESSHDANNLQNFLEHAHHLKNNYFTFSLPPHLQTTFALKPPQSQKT